MIVGGARTQERFYQKMASKGIPYFDTCGATELVGAICIRRTTDPKQREHGFELIPGYQGFLIVDDEDDDFGELVICSKVSLLRFKLI
jgi:acyl-coenzyme A synthetase/AMP-(fatty) acid ligase